MVKDEIDCVSISIEDFFIDDAGSYNFNPEMLPKAYEDCLNRVESALKDDTINVIVVHNVFATAYECKPYFDLAEQYQASARVLSLFDAGLNDSQLEELSDNGWRKRAIQEKRKAWELNVYPHRRNKNQSSHRPRNPRNQTQMVMVPLDALKSLTEGKPRKPRY